MARVFKPTYTKPLPQGAEIFTREGKRFARFEDEHGRITSRPVTSEGRGILCQQSKWYGRYRDFHGRRRTIALCSDRSASQAALEELRNIVELLRAGRAAPPIDKVPPVIRGAVEDALEASGQATKAHRVSRFPIDGHLADYLAYLESKGTTATHRREVERCIRAVLDSCGFATLAEVEIGPVVSFVNEKKAEGASARTTNVYCDRMRSFVRWAVRDGRLDCDRLVGMTRRNETKHRKRIRRPFTPQEIAKLLDAAVRRPIEQQVSGYRRKKITDAERLRLGEERRLVYALMLYTGLRVGELSKLVWSDVYLDGKEPAIAVREAVTKNAEKAALPLHPWLVWLLADWRGKNGGESATGPIVKVPSSMLRVFNRDLEYAGIPKTDEGGRTVDLHACRHSFVSLLAASGTHPRVAQRLARHSKIDMTLGVYTHLYQGDDARAVAALPVPKIEAEAGELQATGTADQSAARISHVRPHVHGHVHPEFSAAHPESRPVRAASSKAAGRQSAKAGPCDPLDTKRASQSSPDREASTLGRSGLEPPTSCVSSRRSIHLS